MHPFHFRILTALIFTMALSYAFFAPAYPHIGDKVQWKGSFKLRSGDVTPMHIVKEVVGFDEASKKWKVKYVATVGNQVTTEFIETSELYSPEKHKAMISKCQTLGGTIEKVTAPAGVYETCKLISKTPDGMTEEKWWGDIPFGVVGRNTTDSGKNESPDLNAIARGL